MEKVMIGLVIFLIAVACYLDATFFRIAIGGFVLGGILIQITKRFTK